MTILQQILDEYEVGYEKGLYNWLQGKMSYHSNKIEGSTLTEDQTFHLLNYKEVMAAKGAAGAVPMKDIEVARGHFNMFDYILDTIGKPLSHDIIMNCHKKLMEGSFEFKANWGVPGEYKTRPNVVDGMKTTYPEDVEDEINLLLTRYHESQNEMSFAKLAGLHGKFEKIHPFQDGNGRTGRIIIVRECLKYNFIPIIIPSESKKEYIDTLRTSHEKNDYSELSGFFQKTGNEFYQNIIKPLLISSHIKPNGLNAPET